MLVLKNLGIQCLTQSYMKLTPKVRNTNTVLELVVQLFQFFLIFYADDVEIFYSTPVDTRVPLDKFKEVDLPANLHIQYEYHRFHPDTDTKFGGISAFPKRSTIVTGLKYKDKYPGYVAKPSWH